jgi:hypothetical protein
MGSQEKLEGSLAPIHQSEACAKYVQYEKEVGLQNKEFQAVPVNVQFLVGS